MIWSSFRTDSLVGPAAATVPGLSGPWSAMALSCATGVSEPDRVRETAPGASRGLFVRMGLVWGDDAGEATLGGCLDC